MVHMFFFTDLLISRSHHVTEVGIATKNDVGAGAVYQAAIISHNAGGGMLCMSSSNAHCLTHPVYQL